MLIALFLALCCARQLGDRLTNSQPYTLESVISDLKAREHSANDRALSFLFDRATSGRMNELADRKCEVVDALIPWLERPQERKNVILILGQIGPDAKAAVPFLTPFIRRSTPDDRLAIVAQSALRRIGESASAAVPDLIESFPRFYFGRFNDPQYRYNLPLALLAIAPKDPKVKELLRKALIDEEVGVRVNSALALWQMGNRGRELKEVWSKAQNCDDDAIRQRVGVILAKLAVASPELLPQALRSLKDKDPRVRSSAMDMFVQGNFNQPEVADAYLERLSDADWYVRSTACRGLAGMGGKAEKAVGPLRNTLRDEETMVRTYGARALYAIDPTTAPVVVDVLKEGLADSDCYVRSASAEGLGELGRDASLALPALRKALEDEWSNVRKKAVQAISKIEQANERKESPCRKQMN